MTHTRNRKLRERSTVRVERLYPALIEGRMAKGHRSLDGPEPWRPKLHGWRDVGYLTNDGAPWSRTAARDVTGDIEAAVGSLLAGTGYVPTMEQLQFLSRHYNLPRQTELYFAPYGRTGRAG